MGCLASPSLIEIFQVQYYIRIRAAEVFLWIGIVLGEHIKVSHKGWEDEQPGHKKCSSAQKEEGGMQQLSLFFVTMVCGSTAVDLLSFEGLERSMINVLLALMLIVSFLGAIALHEWSHALVASWLGDDTPRSAGRQTLNLRSHIDPVGLMLAIILAFQPGPGPVALGWGRPVSLDPWKLRGGPDVGLLIVSCAGIVFSLLIGLLVAVISYFFSPFLLQNLVTIRILQLLIVFSITNVALAIFNLIPCYPLDGYQIVYALLPSKQASSFARSEPYGPFIILSLFFLLPLIGILTSSSFPLFYLAFYIRLLAAIIIAPITGDIILSVSFL
jgi:Zn-dependent protease